MMPPLELGLLRCYHTLFLHLRGTRHTPTITPSPDAAVSCAFRLLGTLVQDAAAAVPAERQAVLETAGAEELAREPQHGSAEGQAKDPGVHAPVGAFLLDVVNEPSVHVQLLGPVELFPMCQVRFRGLAESYGHIGRFGQRGGGVERWGAVRGTVRARLL